VPKDTLRQTSTHRAHRSKRRRLRCAPTCGRPVRGVPVALERQHAVTIPLVAADVTGLMQPSPQFGCLRVMKRAPICSCAGRNLSTSSSDYLDILSIDR